MLYFSFPAFPFSLCLFPFSFLFLLFLWLLFSFPLLLFFSFFPCLFFFLSTVIFILLFFFCGLCMNSTSISLVMATGGLFLSHAWWLFHTSPGLFPVTFLNSRKNNSWISDFPNKMATQIRNHIKSTEIMPSAGKVSQTPQ